MKLNTKIAKSPDDLKALEYKKMKGFIKKDLLRLEKNTTPEKPTQVMIMGDYPYADRPSGVGLILFGTWKDKFKEYAKKQVGSDNPLGAIGVAYYGGLDKDGQKQVVIRLAKGKAKGKTDKLDKGLRKLVPQATFNLVFEEMSVEELDKLQSGFDQEPETDEVFEEPDMDDEGDVELSFDQDYQKLLDSNLRQLKAEAQLLVEVVGRIKAGTPQEDDADIVENTTDLAKEWLELYSEAPQEVQAANKAAEDWVQRNVLDKTGTLTKALEQQGVQPTRVSSVPDTSKQTDSLLRAGEQPAPGMDVGLPAEALQKMFMPQGLKNNCGAAAKYMVYTYLQERGLLQINTQGILNPEGRLIVQNAGLDPQVSGNNDFKMAPGMGLTILQEGPNGNYIPNANYKQALAYIDRCVSAGLPVVAGVTHTHRNDQGYNDGTTDHFIVIVGKSGSGYFYLDPASRYGGKAADNLLEPSPQADYIFQDKKSPMGANYPYIITTVCIYKKDLGDAGKGGGGNKPLGTELTAAVKKGDKNDNVKILQTALNKLGYKLSVDGDFGTKTYDAVVEVQGKYRLPATGTVEPNSPTWLAVKGVLPQSTLSPEQISFQYKGGAPAMNAKAEAVLRDILARANEPQAAIVNTLRTPEQQASVMYLNLEAYGAATNRKAYQDKTAAGKVIDAYEKAKSEGKSKEQILGAMLSVGGFDKISEHCDPSNPAIDIHPASIRNKSGFEAVLLSDPRVKVVCPPKDTTYHIRIK